MNGETSQQNEKTCTRRHMTTLFRSRYQTLVIVTPINSKMEMSSYNLRIIQESFKPKIGRKIRIFILGRKNNILIKKSVIRLTTANERVFDFGRDKRQREIRLLSQDRSGSVGIKTPRGLG